MEHQDHQGLAIGRGTKEALQQSEGALLVPFLKELAVGLDLTQRLLNLSDKRLLAALDIHDRRLVEAE